MSETSAGIESGRPSDILGNVLGVLARGANVEERGLADVFSSITETAALTLRVARASIWLYDAAGSAINCIDGYDNEAHRHFSGEVLKAEDYPSYFSALERLRSIAAMDAEHDPRTEELSKAYLVPHGISTMLDVPILRSGHVVGVVCHEHRGETRKWTETDRLFAGSIGDLVALLLETNERAAAERERSRLAEQLARVARLESLGWLAGSIAHDFRNILVAVLANAQILAQELAPGRHATGAQDITEAAIRARELCDRLLACSGQKPASPKPVNLGQLTDEIGRVLRGRVPANAHVLFDLDAAAPAVIGDAPELRSLILNLLVNALEALPPKGGSVRVRVHEGVPSDSSLPELFDFRASEGRMVVLEVDDQGVGMDAETQRRMFEPLFTTKPQGHGFGLATVLGTVKGHGGALKVESEIGRGTRVRVWFPIRQTPVA